MTWIDAFLPADEGPRLKIGEAVLNGRELRARVLAREVELSASGIDDSAVVVLRAAPGLDFVTSFLAVLRIGAQLALLDHRLTPEIVRGVEERLSATHAISSEDPLPATRAFTRSAALVTAISGGSGRRSEDPLIQLSSGTTAAPKLIRRSSASILDEIDRYRAFGSVTVESGSVVVAAAIAHTWGLFGGLLSTLAERAEFVLPERSTSRGILEAVAATGRPTTVLGVPLHVDMLRSITTLPAGLHTVLSAGAPLTRWSPSSRAWERIRLGQTYGMTEIGVVAADLNGVIGGVGRLASDLKVRISAESVLEVALGRSPYLDEHSERFRDGWLDTRDAVAMGSDGSLRLYGRVDGLVSLAGKKFHTAEVEDHLRQGDGVDEAVVFVDGGGIEAFVTLAKSETNLDALADKMPEYMRPHSIRVISELPRTLTGKPSRNRAAYGRSDD